MVTISGCRPGRQPAILLISRPHSWFSHEESVATRLAEALSRLVSIPVEIAHKRWIPKRELHVVVEGVEAAQSGQHVGFALWQGLMSLLRTRAAQPDGTQLFALPEPELEPELEPPLPPAPAIPPPGAAAPAKEERQGLPHARKPGRPPGRGRCARVIWESDGPDFATTLRAASSPQHGASPRPPAAGRAGRASTATTARRP